MGLVINKEDGFLYWLVKTGDKTCLYQTELFKSPSMITTTTVQTATPHILFEFHTDALYVYH